MEFATHTNTTASTSAEQLKANVKEWIKIDNEIATLKDEMKKRNQKKKEMTRILVQVMKENEIDCFDINDGALVYKKSTIKKPINAKTLLFALQNYYKTNPSMAEEITKHVLDSRGEIIKETITRKMDK